MTVTDFFSPEYKLWYRITSGPFADVPYVDLADFEWSDVVNSLKTTDLLVTGRHHAVFAACKAKTSFVAVESNSHKISGFIKTSGLPIPVCSSPRELGKTIKWAKANRSVYDELFHFMEEFPKFEFDELGITKPL